MRESTRSRIPSRQIPYHARHEILHRAGALLEEVGLGRMPRKKVSSAHRGRLSEELSSPGMDM